MFDPYKDRQQTLAKHYILKRYLQALAFKFLHWKDELTYVDGFSGPWESNTADFSDTSFMIGIRVLKEVQKHFGDQGQIKTIKCFFVEKDPASYTQLAPAVMAHHDPANSFHVKTFDGLFEDAIPEIMDFIGRSFALTFIDPTGWTGYPYDKIQPVLRHMPGEVLINMMYDFINRFSGDVRPEIEKSFEPILGGPGWKARLDPSLPTGQAAVKLFRETLKEVGKFKFVTETCIQKIAADRPHYFLAYGTRNETGLKTFRQVEWDALRQHEMAREAVRLESAAERSGQVPLFTAGDLPNTFEDIVKDQKRQAKAKLVEFLKERSTPIVFSALCSAVLERFMLRETNVKDICVELANEGVIKATWKAENKRKPADHHLIVLEKAD